MKTPEDIKNSVEKALQSVDAIENSKVSPFFKDKTLQRLFTEKEEKQSVLWSWFTPTWQLATLVVIITLNVLALSSTNTSDYEDELDVFAQTYDLQSNSEDNLFN